MKKRPAGRPSGWRAGQTVNHMAVSKALLIIGMFMPKLGLAPFFGGALGGGFTGSWAASFTRSQALDSFARATENE